MSQDRTNPKACPVCGSDSVTQILCDTLLSAHFRGMSCPSEGVVAFHCEGNHVFLLLRSDFRWGEPVSTEPSARYEGERPTPSNRPVKEHVIRKLLDPGPGMWVALGTMFGRSRKLQSLGLQS